MKKRKTAPTTPVAMRVPAEWVQRADEIAKTLSRPGVEVSRQDAFRAAMAEGFAVLERAA